MFSFSAGHIYVPCVLQVAIFKGSRGCDINLHTCFFSVWSCRSVYRRQDVCVAKVILWILSSCTYWWENRYPYPPLLHDGTTPHSRLMTPLPILGWWPPYPYLVDDPPTHTWLMTPPIVGWWPPYPYLADDPPTYTWLMTPPPIVGWWPPYPYLPDDPPPNGWMMCWVKLVLVLYVWRQDHMRPAQQGLPFINLLH